MLCIILKRQHKNYICQHVFKLQVKNVLTLLLIYLFSEYHLCSLSKENRIYRKTTDQPSKSAKSQSEKPA